MNSKRGQNWDSLPQNLQWMREKKRPGRISDSQSSSSFSFFCFLPVLGNQTQGLAHNRLWSGSLKENFLAYVGAWVQFHTHTHKSHFLLSQVLTTFWASVYLALDCALAWWKCIEETQPLNSWRLQLPGSHRTRLQGREWSLNIGFHHGLLVLSSISCHHWVPHHVPGSLSGLGIQTCLAGKVGRWKAFWWAHDGRHVHSMVLPPAPTYFFSLNKIVPGPDEAIVYSYFYVDL